LIDTQFELFLIILIVCRCCYSICH